MTQRNKETMTTKPVLCADCGAECSLVKGRDVFPQDSSKHAEHYWLCHTCYAYIGCFKAGYGKGDGTLALGTAANAVTRKAREELHAAFNDIWRKEPISRRDTYIAMSKALGIPFEDCVINTFNLATCKRALTWVNQHRKLYVPN